jgi:hypothetical protein
MHLLFNDRLRMLEEKWIHQDRFSQIDLLLSSLPVLLRRSDDPSHLASGPDEELIDKHLEWVGRLEYVLL